MKVVKAKVPIKYGGKRREIGNVFNMAKKDVDKDIVEVIRDVKKATNKDSAKKKESTKKKG